MKYGIDPKDLKKVGTRLRSIAKQLRGPILEQAVMDGALVVQRAVQQKAPVDTGAYRSGIRAEAGKATLTARTGSSVGAIATVGTNAAQAFALEFGSGLHASEGPKEKYPIEPDEKKALFWPGAEHPVKRVMHPGIEAQPHFRPGWEDSKDKAAQAIRMALEREVEKALQNGS